VSDSANIKSSADSINIETLAKGVVRRNLFNLAQKVRDGQTLTASELSIVTAAAEPGFDGDGGAIAFARDKQMLARALGVTPPTITKWCRLRGNPGRKENGEYVVAAWRTWAKETRRKIAEQTPDQTALRAANIVLQNEKLEHQLKVMRREVVPMREVETLGGALGFAIKRVVTTIHMLAPTLVAMTVAEAEVLLREKEDEIMEQLHTLHAGIADLKVPKSEEVNGE
jgi:hypothetical protein